MGLDRYMGTGSKKLKKKELKKPIQKNTENVTAQRQENDAIQTKELTKIESSPLESSGMGMTKPTSEPKKSPAFSFVTMSFKCTKCKYKKQMKKPHSFILPDSALSCPKCGNKMKITKK
jgi:Zn finger protein HypA/HybF involved in hydrogenase expression